MNLIRNLVDQKRASGQTKTPAQLAVTRPLPEEPAPVETAPPVAENAIEMPGISMPEPDQSGPDPSGLDALPQVEETSRKIWEFLSDPAEETAEPAPKPMPQAHQSPLPETRPLEDENTLSDEHVSPVPDPLVPRKPRQAGRVKTRLMGFVSQNPLGQELFDQDTAQAAKRDMRFPVGWMVITQGPGRGEHFSIHNEVSTIGRGEDQTIVLNFGDDTISRDNHAALAYDERLNACFVGHSGKANLVRLNGRPILTTEQLSDGDTILVGQTELRFVELCGARFNWAATDTDEDDHDLQI